LHDAAARVFIIDDDHSVRKALGRLLRAAGYQFELFEAAEAYLAGPPPHPPACLLLDIRMPGMNGLELQRAIEGTPLELPIVFITGHADEELLQSLSRRTARVLYKPLDDVALLAAIDAALAQSVES
jgi:FixJ family two-component response regulator